MRIAVSGTACQGKTTLVKDFIKEWPMYSTPEKTYRNFINENDLPHSENTNKDAQWSILNHTIDTIMESEKGDKVIYDRCPLDNLVYSLWAHEKGINDIDTKFINKCIPVVRESLKFLDVIFFTPITKVGPVDIGDNESEILDPNEVMDMESIIRDQQIEMANEKQKADILYQHVQDTRNN